MRSRRCFVGVGMMIAVVACTGIGGAQLVRVSPSPIVSSEFIYDAAPFPSCHASTLAQLPDGTLMAAWFGGAHEGAADVAIWASRRDTHGWSTPTRVATGTDAKGGPLPTWNPVLYQPKGGPLLLFYKVGPAPAKWWGMMTTSPDRGVTWSPPRKLPNGILGPIKNKPILLLDGTLLCPSSDESDGWKLHLESTRDLGLTWTRAPALNDGHDPRQIQPTLLDHTQGHLQLLSRTDAGAIYQSWSTDSGKTWAPTTPTTLPNPNSGIDGVQLQDGRSLLVYNPSPKVRHPIAISTSLDGTHWEAPITLEDTDGPELSYPAVIQTADGLVHITYTWARKKIRHVTVDPARLP